MKLWMSPSWLVVLWTLTSAQQSSNSRQDRYRHHQYGSRYNDYYYGKDIVTVEHTRKVVREELQNFKTELRSLFDESRENRQSLRSMSLEIHSLGRKLDEATRRVSGHGYSSREQKVSLNHELDRRFETFLQQLDRRTGREPSSCDGMQRDIADMKHKVDYIQKIMLQQMYPSHDYNRPSHNHHRQWSYDRRHRQTHNQPEDNVWLNILPVPTKTPLDSNPWGRQPKQNYDFRIDRNTFPPQSTPTPVQRIITERPTKENRPATENPVVRRYTRPKGRTQKVTYWWEKPSVRETERPTTENWPVTDSPIVRRYTQPQGRNHKVTYWWENPTVRETHTHRPIYHPRNTPAPSLPRTTTTTPAPPVTRQSWLIRTTQGPREKDWWREDTQAPRRPWDTSLNYGRCPSSVTGLGAVETLQSVFATIIGAWMRDTGERSDTVWAIERANALSWTSLTKYTSEDQFKKKIASHYHDLSQPCAGLGAVVYKKHLYCQAYSKNSRSSDVLKYSLETDRLVARRSIVPASSGAEIGVPYRGWAGIYLHTQFAVDEKGLWAITGDAHTKKLVIMSLDPENLTVLRRWQPSQSKDRIGPAFMTCGVLYAFDSHYAMRVSYVFDTNTNKERTLGRHEMPLAHMEVTSVQYNPRDRHLYAWKVTRKSHSSSSSSSSLRHRSHRKRMFGVADKIAVQFPESKRRG